MDFYLSDHRKPRIGVFFQKRPRGVSILTVLALVALLFTLALAHFQFARKDYGYSRVAVDKLQAETLRDTAVNLVIAQMREATSQKNVLWLSGAGWMRTLSSRDADRNRVYKLYSSPDPVIRGIKPYESDALLAHIGEDIAGDWDKRPDEFTDLNRPFFGTRTSARGKGDPQPIYPIADPRRYSGKNARPLEDTEGFSWERTLHGEEIHGVDPDAHQLAMPVRWIYLLQDGTPGVLREKRFTAIDGSGRTPTSGNPITGRMAWWTDDESCKVNVNTASCPAVWDTPRTTSVEDRELMAKRQPLVGELQRYPGHPATTDLSAVFFPGRRWTPEPEICPPGGAMQPLPKASAAWLWNNAANASPAGSGNGTEGGSFDRSAREYVARFNHDVQRRSSPYEYYFPPRQSGWDQDTGRATLLAEDPDRTFLTKLEQSGFFLTHKSHSPETTAQGFPRVLMSALQMNAPAYATKTLALPSNLSAFEVSLASMGRVGSGFYAFLRVDPTSRHNEVFQTDARARNSQLIAYLKAMTDLEVPGYPELAGSGFPGLPAKYPAPFNARSGAPFADGGNGALPGSGNPENLYGASERTQILVNIFDWMRSAGMKPGILPESQQYDSGQNQAAGCCCCGKYGNPSSYHAAAIREVTEAGKLTPKGLGRQLGASAILMMVNVPAWKNSKGNVFGASTGLTGSPVMDPDSARLWEDSAAGPRAIIEIGFTVAGFCPKHGLSPVLFQGGVGVGSDEAIGSDSDPQTPAPTPSRRYLLPIQVETAEGKSVQLHAAGANLAFGGNGQGNTIRTSPKGVALWGGAQGGRILNRGTVGICSPFVIPLTEESGPVSLHLTCESTPKAGGGMTGNLRLFLYDSGSGGGGNISQVIDVTLPPGFGGGITVPRAGKRLSQLSSTWWANPEAFPDPQVAWRSLVVPHGDYRIVANPLRVESDVFVGQSAMTGLPARAISFYESNVDPAQRVPKGAIYSQSVSMVNLPAILGMQSAGDPLMSMLPLPPVTAGDLDRQRLALEQNATAGSDTSLPWKPTTSARVVAMASQDKERARIFSWARRDGPGTENGPARTPYRGSSDPDETGDFGTGVGFAPDGPYVEAPDEGDLRSSTAPYYDKLDQKSTQPPTQSISPNFLITSPVDLGSLPSGVHHRVPWQTLRFRPDPGMNDPSKRMRTLEDAPPPGLPFANFCGPRDHLFLDMFWMPVVEYGVTPPPLAANGAVNLNQQIFPFLYIQRQTALHALLRGERMAAIPNAAAARYKDPVNTDPTYRHFINAGETLRQATSRYKGKDAEGFAMPFNVFRSAAEICELWLVPDKNANDPYPDEHEWNLEWIIGNPDQSRREGFWHDHRLTGDNLRERPYSNLYPRVCVRSNVFKVHVWTQSIRKGPGDPAVFDSTKDHITGEWRGSAMIERSLDPNDPALVPLDYANPGGAAGGVVTAETLVSMPSLDEFYTFRVTDMVHYEPWEARAPLPREHADMPVKQRGNAGPGAIR